MPTLMMTRIIPMAYFKLKSIVQIKPFNRVPVLAKNEALKSNFTDLIRMQGCN